MLNIEQVKAKYGVASSTIYRWMDKGMFPKSVKIGGAVRWREEDLTAFDDATNNIGIPMALAIQRNEMEIQMDGVLTEEEKAQLIVQVKLELGLPEFSTNYELLTHVKKLLAAIKDLGNFVKK